MAATEAVVSAGQVFSTGSRATYSCPRRVRCTIGFFYPWKQRISSKRHRARRPAKWIIHEHGGRQENVYTYIIDKEIKIENKIGFFSSYIVDSGDTTCSRACVLRIEL